MATFDFSEAFTKRLFQFEDLTKSIKTMTEIVPTPAAAVCYGPSMSVDNGLIHECCAADEQHQAKCSRFEGRKFGHGCTYRRFDSFCTWIDTSINRA